MIVKPRQKGKLPVPSLERAETGGDVFICKRGHPPFGGRNSMGGKQRFTVES